MSHTVIMLAAGIGLLAVLRLTMRGAVRATRLFLILWLIVSIGNMLVGVFHAGYGWGEEIPIALLVFGLPAAVALLTARVDVGRRS